MALPVREEEEDEPRLRHRRPLPRSQAMGRSSVLPRRVQRPHRPPRPSRDCCCPCSWSGFEQFCLRLFGLGAVVGLVYYAFWAFAIPNVRPDHPIQAYFLPRKWVWLLPSVGLVLSIGVLGLWVACSVSETTHWRRVLTREIRSARGAEP